MQERLEATAPATCASPSSASDASRHVAISFHTVFAERHGVGEDDRNASLVFQSSGVSGLGEGAGDGPSLECEEDGATHATALAHIRAAAAAVTTAAVDDVAEATLTSAKSFSEVDVNDESNLSSPTRSLMRIRRGDYLGRKDKRYLPNSCATADTDASVSPVSSPRRMPSEAPALQVTRRSVSPNCAGAASPACTTCGPSVQHRVARPDANGTTQRAAAQSSPSARAGVAAMARAATASSAAPGQSEVNAAACRQAADATLSVRGGSAVDCAPGLASATTSSNSSIAQTSACVVGGDAAQANKDASFHTKLPSEESQLAWALRESLRCAPAEVEVLVIPPAESNGHSCRARPATAGASRPSRFSCTPVRNSPEVLAAEAAALERLARLGLSSVDLSCVRCSGGATSDVTSATSAPSTLPVRPSSAHGLHSSDQPLRGRNVTSGRIRALYRPSDGVYERVRAAIPSPGLPQRREERRMFHALANDSSQPETSAQRVRRAAETFGHGRPLRSTLTEPCCICLESLQRSQVALTLPCGHLFHEGCIHEWLGRRPFCPLCKQGVV
jgi:hypothetical protein